jgi:hypothetical protein
MDELLRDLLEMLKTVSPEVWQILIRQVYVEALQNLLWVIVSVVMSWVSYRLMLPRLKDEYPDDYLDWNFPEHLYPWTFGLGILVAFINFVMGISYVLNPEFYALRYLLSQLIK